MAAYSINLTTDQDKALKRLAEETDRNPQNIIDEQVSFYIKSMLDTEAKSMGLDISGIEEIHSDEKQAEFLARLLNAKDELLKELKDENKAD